MKKEKLIEYEKIYRSVPGLQDLSQKSIAEKIFESNEDRIVFQTNQYVFAPVLNGFVVSLLEDAIKKGIKTLYFLARDAYFDYKIAEKYVKAFDLKIECRYLCVSRLSLRVPLYHRDIEQALSYITLSGVDVTPEKVINRAGISSDKEEPFIQKISEYLGIGPNEQIPRHRLGEVKNLLKEDDEFLRILTENSKSKFDEAINYLKEAGFHKKEKIAIVDSGWVGSIQQSLNEFRKCLGVQTPIDGYYYGLYEIPAGCEEEQYKSFLFGPRSRIKKKVFFNNCLYECIFSAPHGMTMGYKTINGETVPVLSQITTRQIEFLNRIERGLEIYQENIMAQFSSFSDICRLFNNREAQRTIEKALFSFMSMPSYDEARVFGRLHFSDDVIDYDDAVLATKLTEKDLIKNHFLMRVFLELREMLFGKRYVVNISGWYEGSVMLYSKPCTIQHHLTAYKHYKYYLQYSKQRRWIREREG